jgi:hypothetical protein
MSGIADAPATAEQPKATAAIAIGSHGLTNRDIDTNVTKHQRIAEVGAKRFNKQLVGSHLPNLRLFRIGHG